jgi:hypothetical protein
MRVRAQLYARPIDRALFGVCTPARLVYCLTKRHATDLLPRPHTFYFRLVAVCVTDSIGFLHPPHPALDLVFHEHPPLIYRMCAHYHRLVEHGLATC